VRSGADALQIFDSWVGCLSVEDYRRYVLVPTTQLIQRLQKETKVPIIYFGTDSATLLPSMAETGAEVIGLDWRIPLDEGWRIVGHNHAVQGNLDPVLLFASWRELKQRAEHILRLADARPGTHLQSGTWHPAAYAGGQREESCAFRTRLLSHRNAQGEEA
jgi:uroporphyrinogen decarboxylase